MNTQQTPFSHGRVRECKIATVVSMERLAAEFASRFAVLLALRRANGRDGGDGQHRGKPAPSRGFPRLRAAGWFFGGLGAATDGCAVTR